MEPVWTPYKLQQDTPPLARGLPWEKWIYRQALCDPEVLKKWVEEHGANAPKPKK